MSGAAVSWQGVAGYVRYQPKDWFALSPRAEWYRDRDGFTTGTAQTLKEVTLTAEVKPKDGVMMRVEYRGDAVRRAVLHQGRNTTNLKKNQNTFTIGFVYAFSTKCAVGMASGTLFTTVSIGHSPSARSISGRSVSYSWISFGSLSTTSS